MLNIDEISQVVNEIQVELFNKSGECEEIEILITSNGDVIQIHYLGIQIFCNENEEFETKESLYTDLVKQIQLWNIKIGSIKFQTDKFKIIRPKDFKIDVYRRKGQPSRDPNPKMEVKITHLPTGVERISYAGRSPHQNKAIAMDALKCELKNLGWKNEK